MANGRLVLSQLLRNRLRFKVQWLIGTFSQNKSLGVAFLRCFTAALSGLLCNASAMLFHCGFMALHLKKTFFLLPSLSHHFQYDSPALLELGDCAALISAKQRQGWKFPGLYSAQHLKRWQCEPVQYITRELACQSLTKAAKCERGLSSKCLYRRHIAPALLLSYAFIFKSLRKQ